MLFWVMSTRLNKHNSISEQTIPSLPPVLSNLVPAALFKLQLNSSFTASSNAGVSLVKSCFLNVFINIVYLGPGGQSVKELNRRDLFP